jgi:hypothetical protein
MRPSKQTREKQETVQAFIAEIQHNVHELNVAFRRSEERNAKFAKERTKSLFRMAAAQTKFRKPAQPIDTRGKKEKDKLALIMNKWEQRVADDPYGGDHDMSHGGQRSARNSQSNGGPKSALVREMEEFAGRSMESITREEVYDMIEEGRAHLLPTDLLMKFVNPDAIPYYADRNPEISMYEKQMHHHRPLSHLSAASDSAPRRARFLEDDPEFMARMAAQKLAERMAARAKLARKLVVVGVCIAALQRAAKVWQMKLDRGEVAEKKLETLRQEVLTARIAEIETAKFGAPVSVPASALRSARTSRMMGNTANGSANFGSPRRAESTMLKRSGSFDSLHSDTSEMLDEPDEEFTLDEAPITNRMSMHPPHVEEKMVELYLHTDASTAYPFGRPKSSVHLTMADIRPALSAVYESVSLSPARKPVVLSPRPPPPSVRKIPVPLLNLPEIYQSNGGAQSGFSSSLGSPMNAASTPKVSVTAPGASARRSRAGSEAPSSPASVNGDAAAEDGAGGFSAAAAASQRVASPAATGSSKRLQPPPASARQPVKPVVTRVLTARERLNVSREVQTLSQMRPEVVAKIAFIDKKTPEGIFEVDRMQKELVRQTTRGSESARAPSRAFPVKEMERALYTPRTGKAVTELLGRR